MSETQLSTFQKKLAEKRAREAAKLSADNQLSAGRADFLARESEEKSWDQDLIPGGVDKERSQEDQVIDAAVDSIDIISAYKKWINKSHPDPSPGQVESIMISCPKPTHPDKRPSAWINTEKQTWFCAACNEGGDKYDLAAIHFGATSYKQGANFHDLRKKMVESFGYSFIKAPGLKTEVLVAPIRKPVVAVPEPVIVNEDDEEDNVTNLNPFEDWDEDVKFAALDWRNVVEADTFLNTYMQIATQDDVPEEYHFWNGLMAIGLALGRDTHLFDRIPIYGNLFVCIIGHTGSGKSQSRYHLDQLLKEALPHDWNDPFSKGVRKVAAPASAEALIHSFHKPVLDPNNPKNVSFLAPVRGMIDFNELSALVSRTNRTGNAMKPALMQFYDMEGTVSTVSRTHGVNEANEPFASALTTTQPGSLKNLLSVDDTVSGFLNRWCFVGGPYKKRVAIGGAKIDMKPAVDPLQAIKGWSSQHRELQWSVEAAELFTTFYHDELEPTKVKDQTGLLTRVDLTMKKLILLFAANGMRTEASEEDVQRAIEVYQYLLECYGIPSALIGTTLQSEVHDDLLYIIKSTEGRTGKGCSLNDIRRRIKRKNYPIDLIIKMIKYMTELGEIEVDTSPAGPGRPTVRYRHVS